MAGLADALRRRSPVVLTRWPGAYAVVASVHGQLGIRVDLSGQFPVFFRRDAEGVVYSSRAAVIARDTAAKPDLIWLAARVACPGVQEACAGRSAYADVCRLDPGQVLHASATGVSVWTAELALPDPRLSLADCAAELGPLMQRAVRRRAEGRQVISADFSGGLDSTTLAHLAARDSSAPVQAYTYCDPLAPVGDDLAHAIARARADPRIVHHFVLAEPARPAGARPATAADEPGPGLVGPAWLWPRIQAARRDGSELHITGEGGDALFTAAPAYLADLARRRHFAALPRHIAAWARMRGRPPAALLARAVRVSHTGIADALLGLARGLGRNTFTRRRPEWEDAIGYWPDPGPRPSWLTTRARHMLAGHIADRATQAALPQQVGVADYVCRYEIRSCAAALRLARETVEQFGVPLHAPYLDDDVVRACLALPAHRRAVPSATKPLLARALAGTVPPGVFVRQTKGDYTAEAHRWVRREAAELTSMLASPACADIGLIEPGPVREALRLAILGLPAPWPELTEVLAIESWLRQAGASAGGGGCEDG